MVYCSIKGSQVISSKLKSTPVPEDSFILENSADSDEKNAFRNILSWS